MFRIMVNDLNVYTNFAVLDSYNEKLVFMNILERSYASVQSCIAGIYKGSGIHGLKKGYIRPIGEYSGFIESQVIGKIKYAHGIVKSQGIFNKNTKANDNGAVETYLITNEHQTIESLLFDALYQISDLPLLPSWKHYLFEVFRNKGLSKCQIKKTDDFSHKIVNGSIVTDVRNWEFWRLSFQLKELDDIITSGIRKGSIQVADSPQNAIEVKSIDDYFQKYGPSVIENVMKGIEPKIPRMSTVKHKLKTKTPFPVQAEAINGAVNHLKNHDFVILNGAMGTGKTMMSMLTTVLLHETFRAIIMAPGHILEKWRDEIIEEVENASVSIINDFSEVAKLRHLKGTKPSRREFYLFSKDFAKLSYETVPTVKSQKKKSIPLAICNSCSSVHYQSNSINECHCGSKEFKFIRSSYKRNGVICPDCGELVYPLKTKISDKHYVYEEDTAPLLFDDFTGPSNKNQVCCHCSSALWQPSVRNLQTGTSDFFKGRTDNDWMKIQVARNKSMKTFKTEYIPRAVYRTKSEIGLLTPENHSIVKVQKTRKYSPAKYIKKVLGNDFFDVGIFDEAHLYKSGESAQANAFGQLLKASRKAMVLTGTLAGGVATDLFYLLFRLAPKLMLDAGYRYSDVMKFASDYGVVEETRIYESETVYFNKTSNGRQASSKKIKPGISPLLFSEFLIDSAIFLDLNDFEAFLPALNEYPVPVPMDHKQQIIYTKLQDIFKQNLREKGGQKLFSQMLPVLLSVPDNMHQDDMIHPETGHKLFSFQDLNFEEVYGDDGLLNKERELIKLLDKELKEKRQCFVYCEFTSDGEKNVTKRLKEIIEKQLNLYGQVEILQSSSPQAIKRMAWIKEKASKGIKVFITNPRLVETGLDFVFKHQGRNFNYPTIIFYQVGYNLFSAWQASYRHKRLIQYAECRTYYMYYEKTLQEIALETLANKKAATAALQGTFSEEGLISMANSIDPRVQLANALMNGSRAKDIDKLFEKINQRVEYELSDEEKAFMDKLSKLTVQVEDTKVEGQMSFNDLSSEFLAMISEFKAVEMTTSKKVVAGQLSFL